MKILSVHISVPGDDAAWWRISNIIKILRSAGHEVDVVHYVKRSSYEKLENKERYEQDSFVIASIPTVHLKHLKILRNGDYDLVYGNMQGGAFCSLLGKITKTPLFFDMHDIAHRFYFIGDEPCAWLWHPFSTLKFLENNLAEFMDLTFCDKVVCASRRMLEYLHLKRKIPKTKLIYLPNGVDLNFFKPVSNGIPKALRDQSCLKNTLIFGYIGGVLAKYQGVDNFIHAARRIDNEEIAFVVVGGAKQLREENTFFIPKVSHDQIVNYYSMCDVLVLPRPIHPALELASPTKFAEYAAMGKPILTTNVGDAVDLVRKYRCGVVVEDNTPESLIKGINEFRAKSEEELEEMGENSIKLAENEFDWEKVGINLLKAIESLQ